MGASGLGSPTSASTGAEPGRAADACDVRPGPGPPSSVVSSRGASLGRPERGRWAGRAVTQVRDAIYLVDVVSGGPPGGERSSIEALRRACRSPAPTGGQSVPLRERSPGSITSSSEPATSGAAAACPRSDGAGASIVDRDWSRPPIVQRARVRGAGDPCARPCRLAIGSARWVVTVEESGQSQQRARLGAGCPADARPSWRTDADGSSSRSFSSAGSWWSAVAPLGLIGVGGGAAARAGRPWASWPSWALLALAGMLIRNSVILVDADRRPRAGTRRGSPGRRWSRPRCTGSRPILLTAAAASLGADPDHAFDVFWGPMAFAIDRRASSVGTALTLVFLPALYVAWFRVNGTRREPRTEPVGRSGGRCRSTVIAPGPIA